SAVDVYEGLRCSNACFVASVSCILEEYNRPFEDNILLRLDTLTYDTPDRPKRREQVSRKDVQKWKKKTFRVFYTSEAAAGEVWIHSEGSQGW
uniref:Uncharacterized protein n=1 Tax=Zonotrichia albicollis TaxID=44394 RepID=A0A8D2NJV4_ZONAL